VDLVCFAQVKRRRKGHAKIKMAISEVYHFTSVVEGSSSNPSTLEVPNKTKKLIRSNYT
jgi:hypothetical protein